MQHKVEYSYKTNSASLKTVDIVPGIDCVKILAAYTCIKIITK